uniref:Uncharacterized protein n=1 Tax=Kalanchoe fedtschenkoi TaxID=63787 RepID=A0A7N0R9P4_KALFE
MALLSIQTPLHRHSSFSAPASRWGPITSLSARTSCRILCIASSSPPPASSATDELTAQSDSSTQERSFPPGSCQACGKPEKERGCNGEGRIQGGIATVPGFGWWPIKAYRPCPGFVESGGRYKRFGQSMDDVVSGRGRPVEVKIEDKARDKKPSPRKFTR